MPYTKKNFDDIMTDYKTELVAEIPNVKTSDGAEPIKHFRPIALGLEGNYEQLDNVRDAGLVNYSVGNDLDLIGSNYYFSRRPATPAQVYLKFTGTLATSIPAGTAVQNDAGINETVYQFNTLVTQLHAFKTATTFAFANLNPDTITDSGNGFLTSGFLAGDKILVEGSASNDGVYTIDTVVAGTITLITSDALVNESAGATVTITKLILAEAIEGGVVYNLAPLTIIVIQSPIAGITAVTNPQDAFDGVDEEEDGLIFTPEKSDSELEVGETNQVDTATYRGRLINKLRNNTGKTTKAGYENTALTVTGVATATAYNFTTNPPLIYVSITTNTGTGIPSVGLIADVQAVLDLDSSKDPVDTPTAVAPTPITITIEYALTIRTGFVLADVKTDIETRLLAFMLAQPSGKDIFLIELDNIVRDTDGIANGGNFVRVAPVADTIILSTEKGITTSGDITLTP